MPVPELILLAIVLVPLGAAVWMFFMLARRADRFGYASTRAYLAAAPQSDAERRDAADLALKGLVFVVLGLLFAPLVLVGLVPLFYGGRKLAYAALGLGLVDDPDHTGA